MMKPLDRQDCVHDIVRVRQLLACGIFDPPQSGHVLRQAALIELMICLRDLMHKTETYADRVAFTDDVLASKYVRDITDAVIAIRDACCHVDSYKSHLDENGNRGSFMTAYGKCVLMQIGDLELKSEYEDGIAIFFGLNRLYMKRGVIRAFEEAVAKLSPLLGRHAA